MQSRLEYIDVLRAFACFLVVLTHSSMPSVTGTDGFWKYLISFICSPATQIFFAISGALLIKPDIQSGAFLKKRLLRLLPPVVFWSVITMVVYASFGKNSWEEAVWRIILLPFQPVIGIYWFIYVIIGLYFLTPILSKFILKASKRSIEFYLLLWSITLILPLLNSLDIPYWATYMTNGSYYYALVYFGGYAGFFLLGYYLKTYPISIRKDWRFVGVVFGCLVCLLISFYFKITGREVNPVDYLNISQLFYTTFLFVVFQNLPKSVLQYRFWHTVSIYSFGIYLLHPLIVRDLMWNIAEHYRIHAMIETPLIALVSILVCWGILFIGAKVPGVKRLTGV